MMVLSQAPGGAVSARQYIPKPPHRLNRRSQPPLFSRSRTCPPNRKAALTFSKPDDSPSSTTTKQAFPTTGGNPAPAPPRVDGPVLVGQEDVPLEGVIQFEKPSSSLSRVDKWGRVALLAGGDVLALLVFSAIGRLSHGFPVFDYDTLKTADPFIAGWFLGAYFLGGYGEDGRGMNGSSKAVVAAAKSWAVGIPLGVIIRAASKGHIPSYPFILVTMGSTAVLLIGWRALSSKILSSDETKKSDVYRKGNPFELFELLTSLVRRW